MKRANFPQCAEEMLSIVRGFEGGIITNGTAKYGDSPVHARSLKLGSLDCQLPPGTAGCSGATEI